MGLDVGKLEQAALDVVGVEEGDVWISEAEKLGEHKHGVHVALHREWEDEYMRAGRCRSSLRKLWLQGYLLSFILGCFQS